MILQKSILCLAVMTAILSGCDEKGDLVGVVTASRLACRNGASVKEGLIRYYDFGTPLRLTARSDRKDSINGVSEYWYCDAATGGWVFGGFLLVTRYDEARIFSFDMERIRCNVTCGGTSCFYEFRPFIIGDIYIAHYAMTDYPMDDDPAEGIIMGPCAVSGDSVEFGNVRALAAWDSSGKRIDNIMSRNFESKEHLFNQFKIRYDRKTDGEGTYYLNSAVTGNPSRSDLRNRCKNKDNTEEIWTDFHELKPVTLKDVRAAFPMASPEKK
jgi:hypothetical protein